MRVKLRRDYHVGNSSALVANVASTETPVGIRSATGNEAYNYLDAITLHELCSIDGSIDIIDKTTVR